MRIVRFAKIICGLEILFFVFILEVSAKEKTCRAQVEKFQAAVDKKAGSHVTFNPDSKNMYERLGLKDGASEKEIRLAYKKAAMYLHPERFMNQKDKDEATVIFIKIKLARDTLLNNKPGKLDDSYFYEDTISDVCVNCTGHMNRKNQSQFAKDHWENMTRKFSQEVTVPKEYNNINLALDYPTLLQFVQRGFESLVPGIKTDKIIIKVNTLGGPDIFIPDFYKSFILPSGVKISRDHVKEVLIFMWKKGETAFITDYIEYQLEGKYKKLTSKSIHSDKESYWYVISYAISLLNLNLKKDPTNINYYQYFSKLVKWTSNSSEPHKKNVESDPQAVFTVLFGLREIIEQYKGLPIEGQQLLKKIVLESNTWTEGVGTSGYANWTSAIKIEADSLLSLIRQYSNEGHKPFTLESPPKILP